MIALSVSETSALDSFCDEEQHEHEEELDILVVGLEFLKVIYRKMFWTAQELKTERQGSPKTENGEPRQPKNRKRRAKAAQKLKTESQGSLRTENVEPRQSPNRKRRAKAAQKLKT